MFESLKIHVGQSVIFENISKALASLGYTRVNGISEPGDFAIKGESYYAYPATFELPVRIEVDNDIIKKILSIDLPSYRPVEHHKAVIILPFASGTHIERKYKQKFLSDNDPIEAFVDIEPGDHVVHIDYGIGLYKGLKKLESGKEIQENLLIEYENGDKLYVPFNDAHKVQKYIYFSARKPRLNNLTGKRWSSAKLKAGKGVLKVAKDILEVQAKRDSVKGFPFSKDTDWQSEMEGLFPFTETPDQEKAVSQTKKDMEGVKSMDRLLCGDVGYGKTEVALRAAFKAVMDNKQVAILVPTTILAEQHFSTFSDRLKKYPVSIEMLSRFKSKKQQSDIISALKLGRVDIVIGTHRLLSKDIGFKDMGLLIIDEEQRFGVRHKEKLKKLRLIVDILTLTATPIPRTLYLALMGGRDISIINTPPLNRQSVLTRVIEFDTRIIKKAIKFELNRKGQIFFVHNRIDTIYKVAEKLKRLFPDANIAIGHGRMHASELESTMLKFIKGEIDMLVCTTIIESGIDIPNANTLIVDNAEHFGLADLYQLRGRVGRYTRKAYAYFIVAKKKTLTHDAQRRLNALIKFSRLGSGFKIAMQDLELRGAGNLLGTQQHGYIEQIGFDFYCRLLRKSIARLKEE